MSTTIPTQLTPRQIARRLRLREDTRRRDEARDAHNLGEHTGLAPDSYCTVCGLAGPDSLTFLGNAHTAAYLEQARAALSARNRDRVALTTELYADIEAFEKLISDVA